MPAKLPVPSVPEPPQLGTRGPPSAPVTCVSMGNPHCITFVDEPTDRWVLQVGPQVETDPHFPRRVNAEFVEVLGPGEIRMRVWERGSGETLACGTGACAAVAVLRRRGKVEASAAVELPGGTLQIDWPGEGHELTMTGPAEFVFEGEYSGL